MTHIVLCRFDCCEVTAEAARRPTTAFDGLLW